MGETNVAEQGKAEGTTGQENPQADLKQTSEGKGQTSQTPETFTREQVEKELSDRLTEAGRTATALEKAKADIAKRETAVKEAEAKRQREDEERELRELEEATKEDPEVKPTLLAYKKKLAEKARNLIEEKAEIERRKAELEANEAGYSERFKKAATVELESMVFAAAAKHKVDANILKDKVDRLKLKDEESIDVIASAMPKKAGTTKTDSGKTIGGEDTSNLSPKEKIQRGLDEKK